MLKIIAIMIMSFGIILIALILNHGHTPVLHHAATQLDTIIDVEQQHVNLKPFADNYLHKGELDNFC